MSAVAAGKGGPFELVAVVAMARNRVIGQGGGMPWKLPSDLKHYRRLTMGRPMIMGRKTLQSIGRVLDGRDTIVLTRGDDPLMAGALMARSPEEALAIASDCAHTRGTNEIVIAGGGEIFALFMPRMDRLEVTFIEAEPAGDAWFPPIDPAVWTKISEEAMVRTEADSAAATFRSFVRR